VHISYSSLIRSTSSIQTLLSPIPPAHHQRHSLVVEPGGSGRLTLTCSRPRGSQPPAAGNVRVPIGPAPGPGSAPYRAHTQPQRRIRHHRNNHLQKPPGPFSKSTKPQLPPTDGPRQWLSRNGGMQEPPLAGAKLPFAIGAPAPAAPPATSTEGRSSDQSRRCVATPLRRPR
jgi:hypothetical protein